MNTIWKFRVPHTATQTINIQPHAEIVHIGPDPEGHTCFWAIVNSEEPKEPFTFHVIGTGEPIPPNTSHLGSFTQGPFVYHLFA